MNTRDDLVIQTLTLYRNWHELAKKLNLTKEQYGQMVYAMSEYCFYENRTKFKVSDPHFAIYEMALPSIEKSNKNKIEGSKGGKKAAGKSGAPTKNQNARKANLGSLKSVVN